MFYDIEMNRKLYLLDQVLFDEEKYRQVNLKGLLMRIVRGIFVQMKKAEKSR